MRARVRVSVSIIDDSGAAKSEVFGETAVGQLEDYDLPDAHLLAMALDVARALSRNSELAAMVSRCLDTHGGKR